MSKSAVVIEQIKISPENIPCDVFRPSDEGIARERQHSCLVLADGMMSQPSDYEKLAYFLASEGLTVYSPDYNLKGRQPEFSGAIARRAEVESNAIIFANGESDGINIFAHSLGAVVTGKALLNSELIKLIETIIFKAPAGFDEHGLKDLIKIPRFLSGEFITQLPRLIGGSSRMQLDIRSRANRSQLKAEIEELRDLPNDFMINAIKQFKRRKIPMSFLLGPKDELTKPEPIRRAVLPIVGDSNVIDIHPNAGHISAQTHPSRVGRLVLARLGLPQLDGCELDNVA